MRVEEEDSERSAHYGKHGICLEVAEDEEGEEQATVINDQAFFKIAVRCLVQRNETHLKMRKELKNFRSQSELQKQVLLMMSGFGWAPEREEPIDVVTQKSPECYL